MYANFIIACCFFFSSAISQECDTENGRNASCAVSDLVNTTNGDNELNKPIWIPLPGKPTPAPTLCSMDCCIPVNRGCVNPMTCTPATPPVMIGPYPMCGTGATPKVACVARALSPCRTCVAGGDCLGSGDCFCLSS